MSLEQALQQNTEALNRLAGAIRAAGLATCAVEDTADVKKSATTQAPPAPPAKEKGAEASRSELVYADIQKPFLKLVTADRAKAVALLSELGVPSLKAIEDTPECFADVLAKIQKASV